MADLSAIKIPNGTTYNLKDATARVKTDSISMSASWSGSGPYTQTVTLTTNTPTTYSKIDLQPTTAIISQLVSDGVYGLYILNNNGTLTAYAVGNKPSVAMTMQCTITEVGT